MAGSGLELMSAWGADGQKSGGHQVCSMCCDLEINAALCLSGVCRAHACWQRGISDRGCGAVAVAVAVAMQALGWKRMFGQGLWVRAAMSHKTVWKVNRINVN